MTRTRVIARRRSRKRSSRSREALKPSSLADPRLAGKTHCLFRGPEEGLGFVDAFLLLGGRVGIVDDARAGLDRHTPVLHNGRAQHDTGIHLAIGAEIADASGIGPALVLLQLVDDLHGAHLWRAGDRPGREARN